MSSNSVLHERDCNVQTSPKKSDAENPKSMEYHRHVLENRLKESTATQTYISPSDTIMSPATQKLAAFKHKHMGKGSDHLFIPKHFQDSLEPIASSSSLTALGDRSDKEPRTDCDAAANSSNATKPRSLFAATASKNHSNASAATSQSMFADISKPSDLEPEQGGS